MRLLRLMTCLLFVMTAVFAEEIRTWTDIKGGHVEAAFVRLEGASVFLKLKDGKVVPARVENLSAEDREYVKELTYVPREIVATFKKNGFGKVCEESGVSATAALRDTVTLRLVEERGDKKAETVGDLRWKVESVDALGNRIPPRQEGLAEELVTEGKFIFVTYTVENDANLPITVPSPVLIDKRGRKFLQVSKSNASCYIPENALFAGTDAVQPGFKKLFCSFYEIPLDAEPAIVEVFPSPVSSYDIQKFVVKGKQIVLGSGESAVPAAKQAEALSAGTPGKQASVFMKCVRVGQGGDTSGYWYYDRNKKRSLSYGVELRGMGEQQRAVTVKAFFVGSISNNRDAVVDKKEENVVLEPGKIARISLQSDDVEENTYYYYSDSRMNGAKLKGVIVQVWSEGEIVSSFVSLSQWKKYAEAPDVVKQLGELTVSK